MIPLLAAFFRHGLQGGGVTLPKPSTVSVPDDVRNWSGFKFLPSGPRTESSRFPIPADWSGVQGIPAPNATVWRTKVVVLDRIDRMHERGPEIVWPGHHAINPPTLERIKRALPQLRALVADATKGAVGMTFDFTEETQALTLDQDLASVVARYLEPRINGGRYEAEDGVFRGPYQSVIVIHPVGGESDLSIHVQNNPVAVVGLPSVQGQEADGALAEALLARWREQASERAKEAGSLSGALAPADWKEWNAVTLGADAPTEARLRLLNLPARTAVGETKEPVALGPLSPETTVKIDKDPQRGSVLVVSENGAFRSGGFVLPQVQGSTLDVAKTPTLSFWMKSDAKDPIVLRFVAPQVEVGAPERAVTIGKDVPFEYDGAWHRVKVDLKPNAFGIEDVLISPDVAARARIRETLGPIVASFSDFEASTEPPDPRPTPESPTPTSPNAEARARWAATAGPGEERRTLLKDPVDAVKANAAEAARARPDAADEPALIEDSLYTFEPAVYVPSIHALAKAKTPTAQAAVKEAVRIAAADRARGLAAQMLAESGNPQNVPLFVGLNQARTREARVEAIQALARIPGQEAALMRMAYLAQDDPEVKLAVTRTADPNDDYQARKLLWSAVNEPSDAVRLESLRLLSTSTLPEFRSGGLKGVHDDSVGVRAGLLHAWADAPSASTLPAIREALKDRSARVRSAAVSALSANPAPLDPKDVPFDDPDSRVQLAAIGLAKARKIAIPADVLTPYRASPDPKVRLASGG